MSKDELLRYAAYAESNSNHPIAVSVRKAYGADIDQSQITQCSEIAGKGIKAVISGATVLCGNSRLMADYSINCPEAKTAQCFMWLSTINMQVLSKSQICLRNTRLKP